MDTAKGYTGQYADTLTGLDYYVSRYYDPVVGIFLSADAKEGNAQGMNPYAYVDGDPETMSDPSGEMVNCPDGCGGGGSGNNNGGNGNNNPTYNDPNKCDAVCMEGVGGGGTELLYPGRPSWQQLAFGMIMYGYAAGEFLIPWMVENAFYNDDFVVNGIVLDRAIAFGLALYVQGYRQEASGDIKPTNNLGAGFYYITDQSGNLVLTGMQGPQVGTNQGTYGSNHSEYLLYQDMIKNIIPELKPLLQKGFTLNYIMYTQLPPCQNACKLGLPGWANSVKNQLPAGVSLNFSVYTSGVRGDPRSVPVTSPNQIEFWGRYWYGADNGAISQNWPP